jgi:hypothetical protein
MACMVKGRMVLTEGDKFTKWKQKTPCPRIYFSARSEGKYVFFQQEAKCVTQKKPVLPIYPLH